MLRWLALGTFLTLGSAVLWGACAAGFESKMAGIVIGSLGAVASAWIVPVWWIFNLVLYSISSALTYVNASLLGDEKDAELYFAEVRDRGTSWVVVATEWGLKRYDAPGLVQVAVPEVVTYISPLLDEPLEEGLDTMRQDTIQKMGVWRRRTEIIRRIWAILCFGPLWGSCLLFALL